MKTGRTGVEESDVAKAVEALEHEGIRPTLRAIRDRLGRGSLGTIQRHLNALRPRAQATEEPFPGIPENVSSALGRWMQEVVHARLVDVQADLEEQTRAVDALCADNEVVTEASHNARERIEELSKQLESARQETETLHETQNALKRELEEAGQRERALSEEVMRARFRAERSDEFESEVVRLKQALADAERAQAVTEALRSATGARQELMLERLAEQRLQCEAVSESLAAARAELVSERQQRMAAETERDAVTRLFERLAQQIEHSSKPDGEGQPCDSAEQPS